MLSREKAAARCSVVVGAAAPPFSSVPAAPLAAAEAAAAAAEDLAPHVAIRGVRYWLDGPEGRPLAQGWQRHDDEDGEVLYSHCSGATLVWSERPTYLFPRMGEA